MFLQSVCSRGFAIPLRRKNQKNRKGNYSLLVGESSSTAMWSFIPCSGHIRTAASLASPRKCRPPRMQVAPTPAVLSPLASQQKLCANPPSGSARDHATARIFADYYSLSNEVLILATRRPVIALADLLIRDEMRS